MKLYKAMLQLLHALIGTQQEMEDLLRTRSSECEREKEGDEVTQGDEETPADEEQQGNEQKQRDEEKQGDEERQSDGETGVEQHGDGPAVEDVECTRQLETNRSKKRKRKQPQGKVS